MPTKAIEYRSPQRKDFPSELEFTEALINSTIDYRNKMFRAIDNHPLPAISNGESRSAYKKTTIHEFLEQHPALIKRYKEIGAGALLELP